MLALILAGWTALGSACDGGKLGKEWAAAYRTLQGASSQQQQQEINWNEYYKTNGSQINNHWNGAFVSPTMQWAVPSSCLNGPSCPAMMCPPGAYGTHGQCVPPKEK